MKKILVIVESLDIEDSSGTKVNVALIVNLGKIGYTVKVLHYTRKEIQLAGLECISIAETFGSFNYIFSRFQRVFQRVSKINISKSLENIFGHSFTFFNDSKSISKAIMKHYGNEDLIITLSKGASFRPHYAMLRLHNLHNKWLAYVHDPYPFHYYPRPYNWVEPGYQFKEKFFRQVSEKAKYSGFPSLLLKEWMGSYYPNFLNTGVLIPHQNLESNYNKTLALPAYVDMSKFNILHAGHLMKQRSPEGLIKGYRLFLEKNPEAEINSKLLFLGIGSYYKEYLNNQIDKNVYWSQGNVAYPLVELIQKSVTVNVIVESKAEISPFLPGKFPNCVLANKPILLLSPHYSEAKRLLGEKYEFIAEVDDVVAICNKITLLYQNWKRDNNLKLDRVDLQEYVGVFYLKKAITAII
jgi:hypothetical protein